MYGFSNRNGTTLVELLMTLVLIAVIASLGAPYVFTIKANQDQKHLATKLQHTLQSARTLSLTERKAYTLCLTSDFQTCDQAGEHWMLFQDADQDGHFTLAEESLTAVNENNNASSFVRSNLTQGRVYFRSNGFGGATAGSFYICSHASPTINQVSISLVGNTSVKKMEASEENFERYCNV